MMAAIYARKSTDQTGVSEEHKSVGRQVETAKAYAARQDWLVSEEKTFLSDGVTGAGVEKRPGLSTLMNGLRPQPPFHVLGMSYEGRLGRAPIGSAFLPT